MAEYENAVIVTHASEQSQLMHGQCYERERRAGEWQGWMIISSRIETRGASITEWPLCGICQETFVLVKD